MNNNNTTEENNKEQEPKTSAEIPESEKSDFLKRLEKIKGGPIVFDTHSYLDDIEVDDDDYPRPIFKLNRLLGEGGIILNLSSIKLRTLKNACIDDAESIYEKSVANSGYANVFIQ